MDSLQRHPTVTTEIQENAPSMGATYITNAQSTLSLLLLRLILTAMLRLDGRCRLMSGKLLYGESHVPTSSEFLMQISPPPTLRITHTSYNIWLR
jgi:hypothetical protein